MKKSALFLLSLILLLALPAQGMQAAPHSLSPLPKGDGNLPSFYGGGVGGEVPDSLPYTPNWSGYSAQDESSFGMRIAPAGDVDDNGYKDLLVSAPYYDHEVAPGDVLTDTGRAYLYLGSSDGLALAWWADGDQAYAHFGIQVAGIGDVNGDGRDDIAISANLYDNGQTDEGKIFVWYGGPGGLSCGAGCPVSAASADWGAESNQADAWLNAIAGGDVDGDGFNDLIAGASGYDYSPVADTGAVFVWRGGPGGLSVPGDPNHAYWTAYGNSANDKLGYRVAAVDVNIDGSMDVIASSIYFAHGETEEGAVFAWYTPLDVSSGYPSSPSTASWKVESNQANAYLGVAISTAGDVNGDNFPDLIVSASYYDNGQPNEGLAFVFHGSVIGLPGNGAGWQAAASIANWTVESNHGDGFLGAAVGAAGDVNADGYDDVIVGEPNYSVSGNKRGKAYVFYGSASGLSCGAGCPLDAGNANWGVEGEQNGALLGSAVISAGDVNGNHVSDVFIGAPASSTDNSDIGKAFGYFGTSAENTPPVAVDDVAPPGSEDTVLNVAAAEGLRVNDYDPGGNHNRLVAIYDAAYPLPAHGAVNVESDGSYTYTPNPNWFGTDYFRYFVSDGFAASPSAIVTVTIVSVNDAPVAVDDVSSTAQNTPRAIAVLGNDSDPDGDTLSISAVTDPTHGNVANNGSSVTYTPDTGYVGTDTFSYTCSDGHGGVDTAQVTVDVGNVNDPPVAVNDTASTAEDTAVLIPALANDTDSDGDTLSIVALTQPAHGTAVIEGTSVRYTPAADYHGSDSFTYRASDGQSQSNVATVSLTITPANDPPVVSSFSRLGQMNSAIAFTAADFTGCFSDVDGDGLVMVRILSLPANGELRLNGVPVALYQEIGLSDLGKLAFTPNSGWTGDTSFQWTASDGTTYATSPVSVNISIVNELYTIYLPLARR